MAPSILNGINKQHESRSNQPNLIQYSDQEAIRLVNPLAELGPPFTVALPSTTSFSDSLLSEAELTDADDNNAKNVSRKKNSSRSGSNNSTTVSKNVRTTLLTAINDWLPLQDIWLGPPNTYPISYWARLLGLSIVTSVDVDLAEVKENFDDVGDHSIFLTKDQILASARLRDRRFDPVYQSPRSGMFAQTIWKGLRGEQAMKTRLRAQISESESEDLRILGVHQDPLYKKLISMNNANNDLLHLVMGLGVSERGSKDTAPKVSSRSVNSQRSRVVVADDSKMIIVPVTNQEHLKFQIPINRLEDIIDDVRATAIDDVSQLTINWNQSVWDKEYGKVDDSHSPLPKLYDHKKSNQRSLVQCSGNAIGSVIIHFIRCRKHGVGFHSCPPN
jgi:hypothetical protein